ncbi:ChaN family lipoprotein [Rhodosalinus sp. FB01]|uniref:ChaN family lipoprotein n=1 Tax=Rhodosalinus sp. FB01 TaxID=3239194 RepID=UPI003526B14C
MPRLTLAALALAAWTVPGAADEATPGQLAQLPPAELLILGEVHDNPRHHETQARIVAQVAPAALVFEMLTPAQAARVTPELLADETALRDVLGWDQSGWPDFTMYYPIFAAAPEAAFYGAAVPREDLRGIVAGDDALPEDAARFGLDRPLPDDQQRVREAMQMAAHCDALPEELLPGMVRAQRVRDAALARAALAALEDTGGPVVVITGNGHARTDWGVPSKIARAAPGVAVLSLGQLEDAPAEGEAPYDLWVVTEPVDRPDPCEAFAE